MRSLALVVAAAVGLAPGVQKPAHPASPKPKRAAHTRHAQHEPKLPPPDVKLSLDVPAAGPWTMHVVNDGEIPVFVMADARLLTLEVTRRGAKRARRCELPPDMRPGDELERSLVLAPRYEYVERFDPRLYCLKRADLDALAPAASVVARLGWRGSGAAPPLEVAAIDGVKPEVAPRKSITSEAVTLPDEPSTAREPGDPSGLALSSVRSIDADSPYGIHVPVTLRNEGSRAVVVRFRPDVIAFDVTGPQGAERCSWPASPTAAIPELYTTLPGKRATTLDLELSAYCPTRTFERAGLFVVRPLLDTRRASGARVGIRSFDGAIAAAAPTLVRLRHGLMPPPLARPHARSLDPAPERSGDAGAPGDAGAAGDAAPTRE